MTDSVRSMPSMEWTTGWKYCVNKTFVIPLSPVFLDAPDAHMPNEVDIVRGLCTIHEGYLWDGPSGPTFDTDNAMPPSAVHDAMYYMCRSGQWDYRVWKGPIDEEFYRLLLAYGMDQPRAWFWYEGVKAFGLANCVPQPERNVRRYP